MASIKKLGSFLFGESMGVQNGDDEQEKTAKDLYEKGVFHLSIEDYEKALNYFFEASSLGHISAKYNAGLMSFEGLAGYPDFELAKKLFQEAKEGGHQRCKEFSDFMQNVDEIVKTGFGMGVNFGIAPRYNPLHTKLSADATIAIATNYKKQSGKFIYLYSRMILKMIDGNNEIAESFICNEYTRLVWSDSEEDEKFLNQNTYKLNFDGEDSNEISKFLDTIFEIKTRDGILEIEQLDYARCSILNEILKVYSYIEEEEEDDDDDDWEDEEEEETEEYEEEERPSFKFTPSFFAQREPISPQKIYQQGITFLNSFPPNFDEARKKFQEAYKLGYEEAKDAAFIIGFDEAYYPISKDKATVLDFFIKQQRAVNQYVEDKTNIGNLVYLISFDLKHRVFDTSSNPNYYATRFVDYEIWCLRNYGNDEVLEVHNNTFSLKNWRLRFSNDWENGETSNHSDYLNWQVFPIIAKQSGGILNPFDGSMAVLRAAVVADIVKNYL